MNATAAPLESFPVARFLRFLPTERRRTLPRILSERRGQSYTRHDTIEAAVVTVEGFDTGTGSDWVAKLPHLAAHLADGWKFGYSHYGATHETLLVYLWRTLPGANVGARP